MSNRKSSSSGVFSMMGMTSVSRSGVLGVSAQLDAIQQDPHVQLRAWPIPATRMPLIISMCDIRNSFPGHRMVAMTAC